MAYNVLTKEHYIQSKSVWAELPVFFHPWLLDHTSPNWSIVFIQFDVDNYIVWPYHVEKKMIFKFIRSPFLSPFYGPITIGEITQAQLQIAYDIIPRVDMMQLQPSVFDNHHQFYIDNGFESKERCTFIVDLSVDKHILFNTFAKDAKHRIKQADNSFTYSINETFPINTYFDWIEHIFQQQDEAFIIQKSYIEDYINLGLKNKSGCIINIYLESELVGCSYCVFDKKTYYFMLNAKNPAIKNNAINTALVWQHMLYAQEQGCAYFDFEGSMIPGVAAFNKKFKGTEYHYKSYLKQSGKIWNTISKIRNHITDGKK